MKHPAAKIKKSVLKWIGIVVAILLLLWWLHEPLLTFLRWIGDRQAVTAVVQRYGAWGPLVVSLLLILQVFMAFIPGHALIITSGYLFGFLPALAVTISSTVVGSQVAFAIARRYGRPVIYRLASPKTIDRWDKIAEYQGILFYYAALLLPIFPNDAMCYVAGLGKIKPWRFFLANLLARSSAGTLMTAMGAYGVELPVAAWIGIVLLAGVILSGLYYISIRKSKKPAPVNREESDVGPVM